MNEKFLPELTRRLRARGIAVGEAANGLPVEVDGRTALWVAPDGAVLLEPDTADGPETVRAYGIVAGVVSQVWEYTTAMAAAPPLKAETLHEDFRLLAEFNGVVLAGQELAQGAGYEFATWRRDGTGTGVCNGNYYTDGYAEARLDFACRSGLVDRHRQFTDEQLTEMYRYVHETLDSGYPITGERRDALMTALEQIERAVDDLEERIALNGAPAKAPFSFCGERRGKETQWEMPEGRFPRSGLCPDEEAAEQQADSGPEMGLLP